ncbi:hypothetical protein GZ77_08200 [Endozoicomonas montiporae]|uniref:Uncharacterized protein n=1 Tax=Endozoicomonas montiporae TaxID=1027273 RepID=A0A081N7D7_9GAMM|nr:hypothetical protein GZ77_08200 [Endozoicomonas montiporae]
MTLVALLLLVVCFILLRAGQVVMFLSTGVEQKSGLLITGAKVCAWCTAAGFESSFCCARRKALGQ